MRVYLYKFREYDELGFWNQMKGNHPDLELEYTTESPTMENADAVKGFDAVSTTPTHFPNCLIDKYYELGVRYIVTRSIGFDHIDIDHCKKIGMHVAHSQYPPETVADFSIMLMMMTLRNVKAIMDRNSIQDYTLQGKIGKEISECTVGIIGTGRIGECVIRHLSGFGARILAYDIYKKDSLKGLCEYVDLDTLYKESDVITLHIPAAAEDEHLLSRDAFKKMKKGVCIVNAARGKLIDVDALLEALKDGTVANCALDVLEDENGLYYFSHVGKVIDNKDLYRLESMPNVIMTHHTAFYTATTLYGMAYTCVESLYKMARGESDELINC